MHFVLNYLSFLSDSLDPVAFSSALLEAFELLSKRLRLLEDIPLKISSVQPLDPGFISMSLMKH